MTFENTNRTKQELKKGAQMRISISLVGVIVGGLLLAAVPVQAHHAFAAAFDENRPLNLQGKVTRVELINPHAWIWMDVKGADGKVVNWGIEGGPPTNLFRNGITKTSLPIGTEIKVFAYQAKSGESKCVGVFVEYLDGKKVFMGGSAAGANGQPATPAK